MRLDFTSITISNFKAIASCELVFAECGHGLIFMRGRNQRNPRMGANDVGKSTIWDALTWCLFGSTVGGLHNTDIKPWSGVANTEVLVVFKVDDLSHSLVRTPQKILLNGRLGTQEQVDELLQFDMDLWINTILFGQSRPMFLDLSPAGKMDLLSGALRLNRWEDRASAAKRRTDALEREQATDTGALQQLTSGLAAAAQGIADLTQLTEEWSASWQARAAAIDRELRVQRKRLAKLQPRRDTMDLQLDGSLTELRPLQQQIQQLTMIVANQQAELRMAGQQRTSLIDDLKKLDSTKCCPLCGQPVKPSNVQQHRDALRKRIAECGQQLQGQNKLSAKQQELDILIKAADGFQCKADDAQDVLNTLNPIVAVATSKIRDLTILRDNDSRNPYQDQLQEAKRRQTQLLVEQRTVKERSEQRQITIERTRYWTKGFRDLRLHLLDDVLHELQWMTNATLTEVGLDGWQIKFDVERETKSGTIQRKLHVSILSPDNDGMVRWECWSGGVGARLRIISALALADVLLNRSGVVCGLECLDEPTKSLSTQGVDDLIECLAARAAVLQKQVWFIDHHAIESTNFSKVVTVTRNTAETHIDY